MPAETYAEDDDVYRWGVFHYKDGLLKVNPSACSHNRIGDGKYEVTFIANLP